MANETKTDKKSAPETFTIVQNNRESIVQCQLPGREGKGGRLQGKIVQLIPGMNLVPTDMWKEAKQNASFCKLLDEKIAPSKSPECNPERVGKIILVEGVEVSKDNPLAGLSESDAVEFVEELFDVPAAKRFLNEESRGKVVSALKAQITKIENPDVRKTA